MKTLIFIIVVFSILIGLACFRDRTPEDLEDTISKSDVLKRVNKLCMEMPKPDDFRFVEKHFGGNAILATLTFTYFSDKKEDEIELFYKKWAEKNGWEKLKEYQLNIQYRKGKQTIVIDFNSLSTKASISCEEPI